MYSEKEIKMPIATSLIKTEMTMIAMIKIKRNKRRNEIKIKEKK